MKEGFKRCFGLDVTLLDRIDQELEAVGFTNIQCTTFKLPIGTWPREKRQRLLGLYFRTLFLDALPAISARLFPEMGLSKSESEAFLADVKNCFEDQTTHAWFPAVFILAQKPL